ncbi:uncharacterized protein PHALS_00613 [Plasmopara halstedii]|uniref:Uncharacterized protein n=1 Tax=Plasmopara halstedii TaxID=4781 RepID=A0A0P1B7D7_PLAHL|nr:uncharacterized protein PHALS_00613 [Plasmopara halstedii]CEG50469.1 hypothetical protein PHALS_00613 [Plasmopara halstedii]|eukprot:XP_024586838.1 hypothetical protein PHALS_00613 [Plasmopara halstedii]
MSDALICEVKWGQSNDACFNHNLERTTLMSKACVMGPDLVHVLTPSQQLTIYWWWVVHALITKLLRNLAVDNLSVVLKS